MESFSKRLTQIASYRNVGGEAADDKLKRETDLYKRDIIDANTNLQKPNISLEEKIHHIRKLGLMSWTGGQGISKFTGKILLEHIGPLGQPEQPDTLSIAILKSIVEVSWLNDEIKETFAENNVLKVVYDILHENRGKGTELHRWAVYTLLCLATGNYKVQSELLKFKHLEYKLRKLAQESWPNWKRNAAVQLTQMLNLMEEPRVSQNDSERVETFW